MMRNRLHKSLYDRCIAMCKKVPKLIRMQTGPALARMLQNYHRDVCSHLVRNPMRRALINTRLRRRTAKRNQRDSWISLMATKLWWTTSWTHMTIPRWPVVVGVGVSIHILSRYICAFIQKNIKITFEKIFIGIWIKPFRRNAIRTFFYELETLLFVVWPAP